MLSYAICTYMFDTFNIHQMYYRHALKYIGHKSRYIGDGEHTMHCVNVRYAFNVS